MILIVDDDPAACRALEQVIYMAGFEVMFTCDPTQAMPLLSQRIPDFIFIDLNMPVLDGMALLRQIRANRRYKSVPVAIYSGEFSMEKQVEAMEAGAQAYFGKEGLDWDALLTRFRELVGCRKAPAGVKATW